MNRSITQCPQCQSPHCYEDRNLWVCPECAHEWTAGAETSASSEEINAPLFADSNGNELQAGDTVQVIQDLKVGGGTLKSGTKVKGIRLLDQPVNGHEISCKVDGFGQIYLKGSVVRKVK